MGHRNHRRNRPMPTSRIRLLVAVDIHDGKFAEFEGLVKQAVAVSEAEPGTLGYHFVLSDDRKHCRLIEGYTDADAVATHFKGPAVQQIVPQMLKVATPTLMEFYG